MPHKHVSWDWFLTVYFLLNIHFFFYHLISFFRSIHVLCVTVLGLISYMLVKCSAAEILFNTFRAALLGCEIRLLISSKSFLLNNITIDVVYILH